MHISGYKILEEIGENEKATVYRGRRETDGKSVIIKTSGQPVLFLNEFRKAFETSQDLDIDGVVKIERLEEYEGGIALIMGDFGGVSLKKIILAKVLGLTEQLRIAVKLADILGRIHGRQIIHGDIKPSNIIVNIRTGEVKITDLSSSRAYGTDDPLNTCFMAGTLAYMSPEQTGRMNRMPDYRTDFYSLGITLYEMLSGELPFRSDDPIEQIYWHIAKTPNSLNLINPEMPAVISEIVDKLLAKNPEDRYQSAYGIKYDLEKCLTMLEEKDKVAAFKIAEKDVSEYLNIPHKIYDRESEKALLWEVYERIAGGGRSEVALMHGYAGVGKTAVIIDTYRPIIHRGAFFVEGKYDRINQEIPYSAIIQAFRGLIRQLLTESREKLAVWKKELQAAFGANGQIILDVIPEVALIVGPQPAIPALGPTEAKNVFDMVFQSFFKVFTRHEHPLVMFLDDLQNADLASLKLMETIITDEGSRYFLLVGAYREEEVGKDHPLFSALADIEKANVPTTACFVGSIGDEEIGAMMSDMFSCIKEKLMPLAALVMKKTGGNAFFVNEFITKIYREKLLRFNAEKGAWEWDMEGIDRLGVTENVIDLLIDRLKNVPEEVRRVLSLASCIGSAFRLSLLTEIRKLPFEETIKPLMAAVHEGFLLPVREIHCLEGKQDETDVFRFLHDRIQEASHSFLSPQDVRDVHLTIGRAVMKGLSAEDLDEKVFEILTHLGKGIDGITTDEEKLMVASLGVRAGRKAKAATAYAQACSFLSIGMGIMPANAWEDHYALMFSLYREMSECEYLSGNQDRSEQRFRLLKQMARTDVDQGELSAAQIALYSNAGRFADAQDIGIYALKLFELDIDVRPDQLPIQIGAELKDVQANMGDRKIEDLIHLPPLKDPRENIKMKILRELTVPAYFSNPPLFALIGLKMVNSSLIYGNSPESSYGYIIYGIFLCARLNRYEQGYRFGELAVGLNEKIGNGTLDAKVIFGFSCFINHWKRIGETSLPLLEKAYLRGREYGDFNFSSFAFSILISYKLYWGRTILSGLLAECEANIAYLAKVRNYSWYERQQLTKHVILALQGLTDGPGSFSTKDFSEIECLSRLIQMKNFSAVAYYHINKAKVLFTFEMYREALAETDETEKLIVFQSSTLVIVEHYLYQSLVLTSLYSSADGETKKKYLDILERNKKLFTLWENNCAQNYECAHLLLRAEMERISGRDLDAMELYDQAIDSALLNNQPIIAAHANELAAKFYLAKGREKVAAVYLAESVDGYKKWGAEKKVRDLTEKHTRILNHLRMKISSLRAGKAHPQETGSFGATTTSVTNMVDLMSIIKSSQAISGEIHFNRLVEKLMKILIENAGAQRGHLVIEHGVTVCVSAQCGGEAGIAVTTMPFCFDESAQDYPCSVIQYVKRTEEQIVINDAAEGGLFATDPYIVKFRPKSILCMPIVEQTKTVGILYLENQVLRDAFTPERIEVLELLSSQAAISIKNSLYYEEINRTKEELQESKEKLQNSLEEYQNLFENVQDFFYRTDMDGNLVLVSPSINKILGYSMEEALGDNLLTIYRYPEERGSLETQIKKTGYIENFETELRKKDGTYLWVSANSHYYKDKNGNILGIEGMVRDITKRKQAEEMLLDEKERLSVMLKSIGDGVIATNTDGEVILINKAAEELTGWTQKEACGRDLREVFSIIDEISRERYPNPLETAMTGSIKTLAGRILLISRDGTEKLISDSAAPIRDKDSRIVGAIIVFRDITEKRKLEMEILKNQKLESIGLFAGGIAHDFNNILTGIMGNISLARMYVNPEDKVAAKLNEAEKASLRAKDLTQQLLTFSKGGSPVKKTASITDLLRESAKFILSGSNVKSEFSLPESIWPVEVDEGQINQVINNLVLNAIQSMPNGGTISIAASNVRIEPESPLPLPGGRYVKITIRDEGEGIPQESLHKIFDPFFTTKPNGNGLGLATTYSIIRKHDGHIEVKSRENMGTTAFIYLPASEKLIVPEEEKKPKEVAAGKGKVLLMDDEEMILEIGYEMLKYLGYEVTKARNGKEAIDLYLAARLAGSPFKAVIMDLTIPGGMGGKETIQKLLEIDPEIKAIVSSGYSNDPVMADYQNQGFAGVIIKPYLFGELKRVMQTVISNGQGE
ncbi:MAG: Serine/threonine-protein kinase PknD [Syntrophus sp. SKADARSKE-3]|nr:Serine/threonine-protein kinase PknD [Syntrophus sp. SKADARSKE-3]